ncbi:hypothetical protein ACQYRI_18410 [Salmonella enterica]
MPVKPSVVTLISADNHVRRDIVLADIPQERLQQYIVVERPDSVDMGAFELALTTVLQTASVLSDSAHKHIHLHFDDLQPKRTENFTDRNNRRISEKKEAIFADAKWLLAREVSESASPGSVVKNPSSLPNKWKRAGKIFAVSWQGKDHFPAYALDEGGQPLPIVKKIITLFADRTPWSLAFWFGSPNSWLGSRKPKDLLKTDPEAVYKAAEKEKEGAIHG